MVQQIIKRLDDEVVNKIAAGEVIQRPVNALKELLENSLDAEAQQINVQIKDGGFKTLQVQDNGHGIKYEDLDLLCQRHATSKLSKYEDLKQIATLGFRGEALASISLVSRLTVTTMQEGKNHGYKLQYKDTFIDEGPQACAALKGTTFFIEDLFYNIPTRRKALKSSADEFQKILDLICKYAVYHNDVGFSLKKQGETKYSISTSPSSNRQDVIRTIYGSTLAQNLEYLEIAYNQQNVLQQNSSNQGLQNSSQVQLSDKMDLDDQIIADLDVQEGSLASDVLTFTLKGYISNQNYQGRKSQMVLFINGRTVDCQTLRRSIEQLYQQNLPKAARPFLFFDIKMPQHHLDVNMHPTKSEIGILHRDQMIEVIRAKIEQVMLTSNQSKVFQFQPSFQQNATLQDQNKANIADSTQKQKHYEPRKMVRTDHQLQTLDAFIGKDSNAMQAALTSKGLQRKKDFNQRQNDQDIFQTHESDQAANVQANVDTIKNNVNNLQGFNSYKARNWSVQGMNEDPQGWVNDKIQQFQKESHQATQNIIKRHKYIGVVSYQHALLQFETSLYLVDMEQLSYDLMYQLTCSNISQFSKIKLQDPPNIRELVEIAIELQISRGLIKEDDGSKVDIIDLIVQVLDQYSFYFHKYFGLEIQDGCLLSIPQILPNFPPNLQRLPELIMDLAIKTKFEPNFGPNIDDLAQVFAKYYRIQQPYPIAAHPQENIECYMQRDQDIKYLDNDDSANDNLQNIKWSIEHVFFPSLRNSLLLNSKRSSDGTFVRVASLEKLYKIFERC